MMRKPPKRASLSPAQLEGLAAKYRGRADKTGQGVYGIFAEKAGAARLEQAKRLGQAMRAYQPKRRTG